MDDGRRQQTRNGLIRFKTRPVKEEDVTVKLHTGIKRLREYTIDVFEDYTDPDNFVKYSIEELQINSFFEFKALHLN